NLLAAPPTRPQCRVSFCACLKRFVVFPLDDSNDLLDYPPISTTLMPRQPTPTPFRAGSRGSHQQHPRQSSCPGCRGEGETMTALHIASFKRRRCIAHLEAALEALDLYQRALDDADRMVPQSSEYLQRAQD